jgi:pyruvate-formate lyase-activating enzyme
MTGAGRDSEARAAVARTLEEGLSPAERFGYRLERATAAEGDLAVEFEFRAQAGAFAIWVRPASAEGGAYRQTARFKIGYRQAPPDTAGWSLLDAFCDFVAGSQVAIPMPASAGPDAPRDEPRRNLNDELKLLPETLKSLPPQVGVHARRVRLAVTWRCNERCPFCSSPPEPGTAIADDETVEAAIDAAATAGFAEVEITGGEPTLHPSLPRFVAMARSKGLRVWLQTNARVPEGYWEQFRDGEERALPDFMVVSFHTAKRDRVKVVTGVPGDLDAKVRTVRDAVALGVRVNLNFVLSTLNLDEVAAFPDFVSRTFGKDVAIAFSFVAPNGRAGQKTSLIPRLRDAGPALEAALDRAAELGVEATVVDYCGVPPCALPRHAAFLESDNARHEPEHNPLMTKVAACAECVHDGTCRGFWKRYVEVHGPDDLKPITP